MIRHVLICCRGEIALRFIRTCRPMDISTTVIYSADDDNAEFVHAADQAVRVDSWIPETLITTVINVALSCKVDAVAPGYGPLAENADFADACAKANLIFIGPNSSAIRQTGDKIAARAAAERAQIPIIPGMQIDADANSAMILANSLGYPLLIKATHGGGGRGIRVVDQSEDFITSYEEVRQEALRAFGNNQVYLEKFLGESIRHIEVQILADRYRKILHLGTRECSVQRRRQKIVEEAPAPGLTEIQYEQLHNAALAIAHQVGYDSAGTVEFLLDKEGNFYFIEMNARIQVEHPVTESITGIDIVEHMIYSAANQPLTLTQQDIHFAGHSIEFRICAEDAHGDFLPNGGEVLDYRVPEGPGIRVDSGIHLGAKMSPLFDSLCLKLIVSGANREQTLKRSRLALDELVIAGFSTNLAVHRWLIGSQSFNQGNYDLSIGKTIENTHSLPQRKALAIHAITALALHLNLIPAVQTNSDTHRPISPWIQRNSRWK
ncbi:acetyl-CoA carboxylase biotin carboxylase subunit [Photorhabdus cinerea]|uniref:Biotin carboxylase n=1 Tax=Photorhabdus cinerea TaxID=471575 RepID=A0A7X5QBF5_9GAMM|nr:biotin carboxylase N-terminal domain-containing protein [Photorhabdus cinerea]NHB91207.1 biotin carboxylase [Photorhabdus cinerea]